MSRRGRVVELPALTPDRGHRRDRAGGALVGLGTVLGMIHLAPRSSVCATASSAVRMWRRCSARPGASASAIPAQLALHFLNARVRAVVRDMEWSGNEIMKYLNTEYLDGLPAPK